MTQLRDLVEIRSGYTFREGVGALAPGDVELFQSGDLSNNIDFSSRPRISFPGGSSQLLRQGDILISARGMLKAYIYRDHRPAVASSSVLVLRVKQARVTPEYLAAFFNSIPGLKAYLRLSSNKALSTITIANLGEIDIPDIPLSDQKALGKLIGTIDTMQRRLEEKQIYLDHVRTTAISKILKEYL